MDSIYWLQRLYSQTSEKKYVFARFFLKDILFISFKKNMSMQNLLFFNNQRLILNPLDPVADLREDLRKKLSSREKDFSA